MHLTREAAALGVHGFLAVTPYYNKPPIEGVARHFAAIATAAGDLPVILYNIPQRVILNVEPGSIAQLARETRTSSRSSRRRTDSTQARAILEAGLALYAGNDDLVAPFLELGGSGGICVASHLVGPTCCACATSPRRTTSTRRHALIASSPRLDALAVRSTRSRSRPRSSCSATASAGRACR